MKTECRAMTNSPESLERSVMRSSVMPSLKYSCSGSPLMLTNGSTAMEGLSGKGGGTGWGGGGGRKKKKKKADCKNNSSNHKNPRHYHSVCRANPTRELKTLD